MNNISQRAGLTGAIFAAITMLVLSIFEYLGLYPGVVDMMVQWHTYYNPATIIGTLSGMIEAGVITYLSILLIVWIYGRIGEKIKKSL